MFLKGTLKIMLNNIRFEKAFIYCFKMKHMSDLTKKNFHNHFSLKKRKVYAFLITVRTTNIVNKYLTGKQKMIL